MNDQTYIDTLVRDLAAGEVHPLAPIATHTWGGKGNQHFLGGKLSLDDNLLPGDPVQEGGDWAAELGVVEKLAAAHPTCAKLTYYYLAQAWGSRRATAATDTTTLFDANRLAAARAICAEAEGTPLLVKGSITGIQKYIYDNVKAEQLGEAKRVNRRLRGRSFLVAILGELMADFLVRKMNLEQANILFVGGGHFNLLLPSDRAKDLDNLVWNINQGLLETFQLKLGVVVAYEAIQENLPFGKTFQAVDDQLEARKQQRFRGHLDELFFRQKELGRFAAPVENNQETEEEEQVHKIGRWLPKVDFILELSGPDHNKLPKEKWGDTFRLPMLEKTLLFVRPNPALEPWENVQALLSKLDFSLFGAGTQLTLYRLNDTDFLPPSHLQETFAAWPLAYGYRLIGQYAPTYGEAQADNADKEANSLMELGDLAALNRREPDKSLGYTRLAAMRLDIDDLGALFQAGLPGQDKGLAGLEPTLVLSRELQYFFGGYFNLLARKHHIYIVYSGGDDAFILGSWLNVLYFARDLYRDFRRFSGDNPELTFSAGIFLANPSYPITRLAQDAGKEESKAKSYGLTNGSTAAKKNAIRVFGHTMSWERFIDLLDFAGKLSEEVDSKGKGLRRSVLQHLLSVIQAAEREADDHYFYRQLGRLHALLTRRKINDHKIVEDMLKETADFSRFRDYVLPLHYALYKSRTR